MGEKKIIHIRAGSRGHGDDFVLIRTKPDYYHNTHYNRTYSIASEYYHTPLPNINILAGTEVVWMGITSGTLGSHSDVNRAVYGKFQIKTNKTDFSVHTRYDRNFRGENVVTPGFVFEVPLKKSVRFIVNGGKSFRAPTYTELYYTSPVNIGNPHLKSEHSLQFNTGLAFYGAKSQLMVTYFTSESTEVIDWVRNIGESVWKVVNHGRVMTNGSEITIKGAVFKTWEGALDACILNQTVQRREGTESKYVLNPLGTTISATLTGHLASQIRCALLMRYEDQLRGGSRAPVTASVSRKFNVVKMILSVRNIGNERYEEIRGLPAPGRLFELRMEYNQ